MQCAPTDKLLKPPQGGGRSKEKYGSFNNSHARWRSRPESETLECGLAGTVGVVAENRVNALLPVFHGIFVGTSKLRGHEVVGRVGASPAAPALTGTQLPGHSPLNDGIGGLERHLTGWGFGDRTQAGIAKSENCPPACLPRGRQECLPSHLIPPERTRPARRSLVRRLGLANRAKAYPGCFSSCQTALRPRRSSQGASKVSSTPVTSRMARMSAGCSAHPVWAWRMRSATARLTCGSVHVGWRSRKPAAISSRMVRFIRPACSRRCCGVMAR